MSTSRVAIYLVIFASCACGVVGNRAAEIASPIGLWKNEDATFEIFENDDGPDRIKVRGFIGISLIGRTDVWTRAQ
jgi:hypothetical protein